MAITPLHLAEWVPLTTIESQDLKEEFLNLYTYINGSIGTDSLMNSSITTSKIANGAVTDAKVVSLAASKITGQMAANQLPPALVYGDGTGNSIAHSLRFNTALPWLRSINETLQTILEAGINTNRLLVQVTPNDAENYLRILNDGTVLLTITRSGEVKPRRLILPVVAGAW